jgi:HEAT repeat protein
MSFYCTNCWSAVNDLLKTCPFCGDDLQAQRKQPDFIDKHIAALRDSDTGTQVRAAWVLGERHERKAVGTLIKLVQESKDHYVIETAVEALGKIGDWSAWDALQAASAHPNSRVRDKSLQAIQRLQRGPDIHRR